MKKRNLIFLFLIVLLNSFDKDFFYEKAPKEPNKKKLLELVNEYRQNGCNCGSEYFPPVEPVVWNDLLESAAQIHSNDMNKNNFFSHTGSDGNSIGYRVSNVGYDWIVCGENIAKGYKSEDDVIIGWINSEGHCKNIMNPNFRDMGVATGGVYWTQVFGKMKE